MGGIILLSYTITNLILLILKIITIQLWVNSMSFVTPLKTKQATEEFRGNY